MPAVGVPPTFHGKVVLVDFSPAVRNPRIVAAAISGLVRRIEDAHGSEDELMLRIHELVAEYDGLTARLVGRTPEAIEFAVTRQ